jgi:hypothetical protein
MKGSVRQYRNILCPIHKTVEKVAAANKGGAQKERIAVGIRIGPGGKGSAFTVVLPVVTGEGKAA